MSAVAAEEPSFLSDVLEKDQETGFCTRIQEIRLTGDDEEHIHMVQSSNVVVTPSSSSHRNTGSNRVKINNIVDYPWKQKYYFGHLVSSTRNGQYIAYSLIATKTTSTGVVRVIKPKTEQRTLIKGYQGHIKDLAFAFMEDPILASIDEYGSVLVHSIEDDRTQLLPKPILRLNRGDTSPSDYHTLFWCPYIPEAEETDSPEDTDDTQSSFDNSTMLLAMTHDCEVEVVNVNILAQKYGSNIINTKTLPVNYKMVIEHEKPITVATFSPDGSAIATGGLEGEIKFFQVSSECEGKSPGCLHRWTPHEGRSISSLFFLDNWKQPQPELQFWKFALTGADYNRELKLWSCESWKCLQTITFESRDPERPVVMRAELDSTAQYLLLSDVYNKAIYVIQIYQNSPHTKVTMSSIAEFSVAHSVLSLTIVDALKCLIKMTDEVEPFEKNGNDQNGNGEDDDESPDAVPVKGTLIKCFWINEKSLQGSRITYQPPLTSSVSASEDAISLMSHDSVLYRDRLSDLSSDLHDSSSTSLLDKEIPVYGDTELVLPMELTSMAQGQEKTWKRSSLDAKSFGQDSYISPLKSNEVTSIITPPSVPFRSSMTPTRLDTSTGSACKLQLFGSPRLSDSVTEEPPLATSEQIPPSQRKSSQRSSASSPSQEVADILAPTKGIETDTKQEEEDEEQQLLEMNSHGVEDVGQTNGVITENTTAKIDLTHSQNQSEFICWPMPPDLSKEYRIVGRNSLDKESAYVSKPQETPVEKAFDAEVKASILSIQQALESLNRNMFALKDSNNGHGSEIKFLQQSLYNVQQQFLSLQLKLDKFESSLYASVQKIVTQQSQLDNSKIETLFAKRQEMDRQFLQKQAIDASQCVTSIVSNSLDKTIQAEMKNTVLPTVGRLIDSWKDQVQQDFVQRMSISETGIKDSMKMLLKNKSFIDTVSQNVATCIQPQIQVACRELFQQNLVPNVDRVCQGLFVQLSENFKAGTKEYLQQSQSFVENSTKELRGTIEATASKFEKTIVNQQSNYESFLESVDSRVLLKNQELFSKFTESVTQDMRKMVAEEVKEALKEHNASASAFFGDGMSQSSRMMTPVSHVIDPQLLKDSVVNLLRLGHYDAAFQEALNSKDLSLLMFTCENSKPETVVGISVCKLKSNVLISMAYQLSSCINTNTELVLRYIQGVIFNLKNIEAATNHTHLKKAVTTLIQSLTAFSDANPTSPHISQVNILIMAASTIPTIS